MMTANGTLTARQLETLLGQWQGDVPAYEALADRIRLLAIDGRILPGTRLPSERELAERLGRSRTTVVSAYRALRDAGYLESRQGSGSVLRLPTAAPAASDPASRGLVNFSMACPPALAQVTDYAARALERLPASLSLLGVDFVGNPALREAIARRYTERGLPTVPDQLVVTAGAQNAIALVAHALLNRGDRALMEAPTYPHAYEALRAAGARIVGAAVSPESGWDADQLLEAFERSRPALAYLMPDFQNPTGASMPIDLRRRVVAAAARSGTIVVDDQTTGELVIDRPWASLPLAAYAETAEEQASVITLGSTGKTVWGGLRLGWIRADEALVARIVAARPAMDLGVPVLDQLIAAEAIAEMDEILAFRAQQLGASRDLLRGLLAERIPEWHVPNPDGGTVLWVGLGAPVSSALALAARARGLQITAGPVFGADGAFERFIRVPFTPGADDLRAGVDVLATAWRALGRFAAVDGPDLTQVA